MESPFARSPESAVRQRLSRPELCGEAIYELIRCRKIDQETFTARMRNLDACGPNGAIGSCYTTWLLLRAQPECQERDLWMAQNTMKLREAVRYLEPRKTWNGRRCPREVHQHHAQYNQQVPRRERPRTGRISCNPAGHSMVLVYE